MHLGFLHSHANKRKIPETLGCKSLISLMMYCSTLRTCTSKDNINRIFKLPKRCARIILNAEPCHLSVDLFNELSWLPFFVETDVKRCVLAFNGVNNNVPNYVNKLLKLNNEQHKRSAHNASIKFVTPQYAREREGGKTFTVVTRKLWSKLHPSLGSFSSLRAFEIGLRNIFLNFQTE